MKGSVPENLSVVNIFNFSHHFSLWIKILEQKGIMIRWWKNDDNNNKNENIKIKHYFTTCAVSCHVFFSQALKSSTTKTLRYQTRFAIPLMHNVPKCCMIFKVCLTILRRYVFTGLKVCSWCQERFAVNIPKTNVK